MRYPFPRRVNNTDALPRRIHPKRPAERAKRSRPLTGALPRATSARTSRRAAPTRHAPTSTSATSRRKSAGATRPLAATRRAGRRAERVGDDLDKPPELIFYCPACAEREFGDHGDD